VEAEIKLREFQEASRKDPDAMKALILQENERGYEI
jgi:hypothetical protein